MFIAIISNASLKSDWVRNEINYAKRKGKVVFPVLLQPREEIEESLQFQVLDPYFGNIQWYTVSGNLDADALTIVSKLPAPPRHLYQDLVERALSKHALPDASQVLCGLLWLLRECHIGPAMNDTRTFPDGLGGATGRPSRSVGESLRNTARAIAKMNQHNADNHRRQGDPRGAEQFQAVASTVGCLEELLSAGLRKWDAEAGRMKEWLEQQKGKNSWP